MDFRALFAKRNVAPGTGALMSASWLSEQFIGGQAWFPTIPFGWFALIAFAFWLGQDLYHPNGRLRERLREFRSIGTFGKSHHRRAVYNRGEDYGGEKQHISILIPFKFKSRVVIDAIRMTGDVHCYNGSVLHPPRATYVWKIDEGKMYFKEDVRHIPVAHIPSDYEHPGFYGDMDLKGYYLGKGTAHYVTIEVCSGIKIQSHRILILMPNNDLFWVRDGQYDVGGRFIVIEEEEELFPPADSH